MLIQQSATTVLWDGVNVKRMLDCAIGKNGFSLESEKTEGDGKTPTGAYDLLSVYYRPDRVVRPKTILPTYEIKPNFLWCDDPSHPLYNQFIEGETDAKSYEYLHRAPSVYDILITTNHNKNPTRAFAGSAIFIHCTEGEPLPYKQSEGCLKLSKEDIVFVLQQLTQDTKWILPDMLSKIN